MKLSMAVSGRKVVWIQIWILSVTIVPRRRESPSIYHSKWTFGSCLLFWYHTDATKTLPFSILHFISYSRELLVVDLNRISDVQISWYPHYYFAIPSQQSSSPTSISMIEKISWLLPWFSGGMRFAFIHESVSFILWIFEFSFESAEHLNMCVNIQWALCNFL